MKNLSKKVRTKLPDDKRLNEKKKKEWPQNKQIYW